MSDDTGYEPTDPKHPDFYESAVSAWDNRDKTKGRPETDEEDVPEPLYKGDGDDRLQQT